jgi:hypothetical protein
LEPPTAFTEFRIFNRTAQTLNVPLFDDSEAPVIVTRDGIEIPFGVPNCLKSCSDQSPSTVQCDLAAPFTEFEPDGNLSFNWDGQIHEVGNDVWGNECQSTEGLDSQEAFTVKICVRELSAPNGDETGRKACAEEVFNLMHQHNPDSAQVVELEITEEDLEE